MSYAACTSLTVSVVIPVRNAAVDLASALSALANSRVPPSEIIVVDDGSTDDSGEVARKHGAVVIRNAVSAGPAAARNLGATLASGDILLFIDADVCVQPRTIERILDNFENDLALAAVFGSYEAETAATDFLSRYKNFQHHFVHQHSQDRASTFWTGCGAIRKERFFESGGFSTRFTRPAVEDIELGMRLARGGAAIRLDKSVQVTHLKHWRLRQLIRTEVLDRAIPWTELLLANGAIPDDLNLTSSQRFSAGLALMATALAGFGTLRFGLGYLAPFLSVLLVLLAPYWLDSLHRGARRVSVVIGAAALAAAFAWWDLGFPKLPALLLIAYASVWIRDFLIRGKWLGAKRSGIVVGLILSAISATFILRAPHNAVSVATLVCGGLILWINRAFYLAIGRKWGFAYAASSVPFHFFYQLYSSLGFAVGTVRFHARRTFARTPADQTPIPVVPLDIARSAPLPSLPLTAKECCVVLRRDETVLDQFIATVQNGQINPEVLQVRIENAFRRTLASQATPSSSDAKASVVICTRNRPNDLQVALTSVYPLLSSGHEVIVVDSCPSTDASSEVVSSFPGIRYVRERRPGAAIARNTGLLAAKNEIVAYTDDDARVDARWLSRLLSHFEGDPSVALVTGITLPAELETQSQIWFERASSFNRGFEIQRFDFTTIDPLLAGKLGASVNMACRRRLIEEIGLFDEALGPGRECESGEDHEFYYRILRAGHRAVYDPGAVVWHHHRRDWNSLRKVLYGYGVGVFAWWTRALVREGEWGVIPIALRYFTGHHVRNLIAAMFRSGSVPFDLALAEFRGALNGPFAYWRACRRLQAEAHAETHHLQHPSALPLKG
jgi:glycosyltransferase involved in cell wall biosynthesis